MLGNWHFNEAEQTESLQGIPIQLHRMPQCSAEFRQSTKWLIAHLHLIQALCNLTTFYYLAKWFGEDTRVEANEVCKSK